MTEDERTRLLVLPTAGGTGPLVDALHLLDDARLSVDDIGVRRPTLDDVFLTLTGHAAVDGAEADGAATPREGQGGGPNGQGGRLNGQGGGPGAQDGRPGAHGRHSRETAKEAL